MKKIVLGAMVLCLAISLTGCGTRMVESGKAAIEIAKNMKAAKEKVDYLIGQAKAFQKAKDFQSVVDIARYILISVDKNSTEARTLLRDARDEILTKAKSAGK